MMSIYETFAEHEIGQELKAISGWLDQHVDVLGWAEKDIQREGIKDIVKMRWRIERDYQELKQEFGLDNFEGRNWRGFHHHATLCIAAYGFLVGERLVHGGSVKKNDYVRKKPALPESYAPRGARSTAAARIRLDHDAALGDRRGICPTSATLPVLRTHSGNKSACVTQ